MRIKEGLRLLFKVNIKDTWNKGKIYHDTTPLYWAIGELVKIYDSKQLLIKIIEPEGEGEKE